MFVPVEITARGRKCSEKELSILDPCLTESLSKHRPRKRLQIMHIESVIKKNVDFRL